MGSPEPIRLEDYLARPKRAHMEPNRCGPGAAVEGKSDGTLTGLDSVGSVGDVKHEGIRVAHCVAYWQFAHGSGVTDSSATNLDLVVRNNRRRFCHVEMQSLGRGLRSFRSRRRLRFATRLLGFLPELFRLWRIVLIGCGLLSCALGGFFC